eukprot:CAMPEP_0196665580 /NCGR_PEP_ID=MMETSP1086-20130531/61617_1 /TAXON_ID=77921 /ORGANISM="Cyanoptyche  gloeocystis , Strain SAG4.97" /LENGTH=230 /DNA_ID=CAMNT_0042002401 /DNA_START=325 /DNA_END=1017 /DNA_ORIENTATION=+
MSSESFFVIGAKRGGERPAGKPRPKGRKVRTRAATKRNESRKPLQQGSVPSTGTPDLSLQAMVCGPPTNGTKNDDGGAALRELEGELVGVPASPQGANFIPPETEAISRNTREFKDQPKIEIDSSSNSNVVLPTFSQPTPSLNQPDVDPDKLETFSDFVMSLIREMRNVNTPESSEVWSYFVASVFIIYFVIITSITPTAIYEAYRQIAGSDIPSAISPPRSRPPPPSSN